MLAISGALCHYVLHMNVIVAKNKTGQMEEMVKEHEEMLEVPAVGEIVDGNIIDKARNAMYVDLGPLGVGVIYGRDLFDDMDTFKNAKLGDAVQATVQKYDNEDDLIELSLRSATQEKSWEELRGKVGTGEIFDTEVIDANKGGLMVRVHGITGFLPVSQLAPDNYPRVEGGDKNKIFELLRDLVGKSLKVKVINAEQETEKLIVSEKAAISDEISGVLEGISVGDVVKGTITGVVDFGVFVMFEKEGKELEGLVHISELAWQRIDKPGDFVNAGDVIEAKVIGMDGLRISLSIKELQDDPWSGVGKKYQIGDEVEGEVLKVTPFGGFVKLDNDIHGLVHISELPKEAQSNPETVLKAGEMMKFIIISMQPEEHRLGLSLIKKTEKKSALDADENTKEEKKAEKKSALDADENTKEEKKT